MKQIVCTQILHTPLHALSLGKYRTTLFLFIFSSFISNGMVQAMDSAAGRPAHQKTHDLIADLERAVPTSPTVQEALVNACVKRDHALVQCLLAGKATYQQHPSIEHIITRISYNMAEESYTIIRCLLHHKVDPNINRGYSRSLLAAAAGHAQLAQILIDAGASLDAADCNTGNTPLHEAALAFQGSATLKLLLAAGANPNLRNKKGKTPLECLYATRKQMRAEKNCRNSRYPEVQENILILEEAGRNVPASESRFGGQVSEALCQACYKKEEGLVRVLLAGKADPNAIDRHGKSALMITAMQASPETVLLLLQAGANRELCNFEEKTALQIAREKEQACAQSPDLYAPETLSNMQRVIAFLESDTALPPHLDSAQGHYAQQCAEEKE